MKKIILISALSVLFGCSDSDDSNVKDKNVITQLASKYHAQTDWDSPTKFSYEYQESFNKKPILFKGKIYDILKKDSSYVLKVMDERIDSSKNFLALIKVTQSQFDTLIKKRKSNTGAFIINVSEVTSSNPKVVTEEETGGEDESSSTVSFLSESNDISIFNGKLIDLYLIKDENN